MRSLLGRLFGKPDPEPNSGIPFEVPGGERPLTMQEMIQKYIREEVSRDLGNSDQDVDSFDEADDFEEEDPETIPLTHHQVIAMTDDELRDVASGLYGVDLVDNVGGDSVSVPPGSPGGSKASNPAQPAPPFSP